MEYKLPELPEEAVGFDFDYYDGITRFEAPVPRYVDERYYKEEQMRKYAEQAVAPLLAEIQRLKRGEFICKKCGLRKDAECEKANF